MEVKLSLLLFLELHQATMTGLQALVFSLGDGHSFLVHTYLP
jgi:hypothetical protein